MQNVTRISVPAGVFYIYVLYTLSGRCDGVRIVVVAIIDYRKRIIKRSRPRREKKSHPVAWGQRDTTMRRPLALRKFSRISRAASRSDEEKCGTNGEIYTDRENVYVMGYIYLKDNIFSILYYNNRDLIVYL